MIVIQTYKTENRTGVPVQKNYYVTNGLQYTMAMINIDRENNDLNKFGPITIYNVFDTEE